MAIPKRKLPDWLRQVGDDTQETVAEFESWHAWVEHCEKGASDMKAERRSSRRERGGDHRCYLCCSSVPEGSPEPGWTGSKDWSEALQLAKGKADNGIATMRRYYDVLNTKIGERILQPQYYLGDDGCGEIDMGTYMSGVPEIYMTPREHYTIGPSNETALLFFHMGYSACVSETVIETRGAVALALASLFEQGGVPTRIVCALGKNEQGFKHSVLINFKDYGEPLDLPVAAYAFCNPGANRRLGFSHYEQLPSEERRAFDIGGLYARPTNASHNMIPEEAIVFHHGMYNEQWRTPETAKAWIEELLASKGVELVAEGE